MEGAEGTPMRSVWLRVLATIIAIPLQALVVIMLIGMSKDPAIDLWKDADPATSLPLFIFLFSYIPLLSTIWTGYGGFVRRLSAWIVGVSSVIVVLSILHPLAVRLIVQSSWTAVQRNGTDEHFSYNPIGLFVSFFVVLALFGICAIAGRVPVWAILRRRKQALFAKEVELAITDEEGRPREAKVSQKQSDKLIAGGKIREFAPCTVHIIDPWGNRTETWEIGKDVTREVFEKFKDTSGNLYATVTYTAGEPDMRIVAKQHWDQLRTLGL